MRYRISGVEVTVGAFLLIGLYSPMFLAISVLDHFVPRPFECWWYDDVKLVIIGALGVIMPYFVMWYTKDFFSRE